MNKKIYHTNVNVSLTEENVFQIESEIMINVNVENIIYLKKIIKCISNPTTCSC